MRNCQIELIAVIPGSGLCRNRELFLIDMEELRPNRNEKVREHNGIDGIAPARIADFRTHLCEQKAVKEVIGKPEEQKLSEIHYDQRNAE